MASRKKDPYKPPEDALWMVPLGGCAEIGMNMYLYGTCGKWLMVECGVTFPDDMTPGIEIIMPDISFIYERRDDLVGIVVTHGHEDHFGAIEYLWSQLQCPVYAAPFTAAMLRAKLAQAGMKGQVRLMDLPLTDTTFEIGPFKGELIPVTHSVPDSRMLALKTPNGTIVHTGDWKFDGNPVVGALTDEERLKALGGEGVMAVMADSTNAMVPGHSRSEKEVQHCLIDLFGKLKNRIVVTCFSSNVARMKSIAKAAHEQGRYVALVGRSLWRNAETAEAQGYLPMFSDFLSEHEAMQAPRDKVVLITTGCQGEPRSALSRIAVGEHPSVTLDKGDTVIFSSRNIPGNEKAIARVQNGLIQSGIEILTPDSALVHVSGHAHQEEVKQLYQWLRPSLSVPVHGELRHRTAHAHLAEEAEVPAVLMVDNGQIARLGPGVSEIVGEVQVGRVGLDGKVLRMLDRDVVKHRRRMSFSGAAVVTVVIDQRGMVLSDPQVSLLGLEDNDSVEALRDEIIAVVLDSVESMPKSSRLDDEAVKRAVVQGAKRSLNQTHGKRPVLDVHLIRVK